MNKAHLDHLIRKVQAPAETPSARLAKSQAALKLVTSDDVEPTEALKVMLEELLDQCTAAWEDQRAAKVIGSTLDLLEPEPPPEPEPVAKWLLDAGEEAQVEYLQIFLKDEMAHAVGWRIRWGGPPAMREAFDSPRVAWLREQYETVMSSPDPLEASQEWLSDPPVFEARKIAKADGSPEFVPPPDLGNDDEDHGRDRDAE